MVGCDNEDCALEWFHYSCVGLLLSQEVCFFLSNHYVMLCCSFEQFIYYVRCLRRGTARIVGQLCPERCDSITQWCEFWHYFLAKGFTDSVIDITCSHLISLSMK